ncbi:glycosyltransferase family 2 protein [Pandoraea sp. ISTKB]|uniref:glycosyltransferase family 2 protein n=1 Tax=Pandoraea sp. ISTKB TaxID=1586708 RepID=UPI0008464E80|nr:glycosyltransferase family 2 protein [Pandoraea sp. ISTKB]ODP31236.1 glycosyl transferase [Pandoraea sp. ISTKB]
MASLGPVSLAESEALSVVVPVFRSAASLPLLHERLTAVLEAISAAHEIILVEDGGNDGTWDIITSLAAADSRVRGIRMSRNYGQHNALLCGIRAAVHPLIVTLDDDLQHPPEEIPRLLEALGRGGFDVVYGAPEREQHSFWRDTASVVTKIALMNAMGAQTARHVSAFRVFRTSLRNAFANYSSPLVSIDVLLTWGTTRFTHLKVRHEPRRIGVSNYSVWKLFTHAMNMITGFSTIPLQLASFIGFGSVLLGIVLLGYIFQQFAMHGRVVPGFYFIASIITVFAGAQLFALGMIGEYLARMYFRSMDKPVYSVAETTSGHSLGNDNPVSAS